MGRHPEKMLLLFWGGWTKGWIVWNAGTWFPEIGTILRGGGWGSTAVWNLSQNSSDLVAWSVLKKSITKRHFITIHFQSRIDEFSEKFQRGVGVQKCLLQSVSCFDFSELLKKHTLNHEITLLNQFHAQKALFKVRNIYNVCQLSRISN